MTQPTQPSSEYQKVLDLFQDWRNHDMPVVTDWVPDYTAAAMDAKLAGLPPYRARLDAIDVEALTLAERVDLECMRSEMNGLEYYVNVLKPWQRDPSFYCPMRGGHGDVPDFEAPFHIGMLLPYRFDFPLKDQQYETFRGQLEALPAILAQAKSNLTADTKTLYTFGIGCFEYAPKGLIALGEKLAEMHPELVAGCTAAAEAATDFGDWLKERHDAMPDSQDGLTIDQYNWAMKNVHRVPYDWHEQEAILQRELQRAWASMKLEEHRNRHLPELTLAKSVEEMAERVRAAYPQFMNFLKEKEIFTVEDWMDLSREPGDSLPAEEDLDFFCHVEFRHLAPLRCHMIHYLELDREERNEHPIRGRVPLYKIWSTRSEGLATAFEEIMMQAGFLDDIPRAKELVHALAAFRAARGLAGLRVHGKKWTFQQALDFSVRYTPNNWLKPDGGLIFGDLGLYYRTPVYGPSYTVGKVQLERLMADCAEQKRDDFTLKGFFDEYFAMGTIPASLVRWQMTGVGIEERV